MQPFFRRIEGSRAQSSRRSGVEPHGYQPARSRPAILCRWTLAMVSIKNQRLLLSRLHHNRRPISQYLSDALHNLGSVIPRSNYSVATQFGRVLRHKVKSFQTGLLTQICEQRDVAADERLQAGA